MNALPRHKALTIYLILLILSICVFVPLYNKLPVNNYRQNDADYDNPTDVSQSNTEAATNAEFCTDSNLEPGHSEKENTSKTNNTTKPNTTKRASTPASGLLRVEGTKLVDKKGNTVQLRGLSTHGIAWYPQYVNNQFFKELRTDWNANVIRLAMYTAEYGGYCSGGDKANLKKLIDNGVKYATNNGLYVIIDWHILSDGNPNTYINESKAFFAEMSKKYANHNNVIYEICNEPNGGTSWSQIKSYAETIIGVIRQNDSDAVILVGTPNWSQYVNEAAANPITKYNNIMYTLHFYAATHTDSLRNTLVSAVNSGLPIFVSEFGICDASGNGGINETQANKWIEVMNQHNISYVAWNISNKNETSAIINSNCSKTNGFSWNDLSASGKWVYKTLTGSSNLTGSSSVPSKAPSTTIRVNPTTTEAQKGIAGNPTYTAKVTNSWESGAQVFYQYELTLSNPTNSDFSSWNVTLPFNESITLSNGWNGNYSVSGNKLRITSMDYNGNIPAGSSIGNIGFIVAGSKNLKLT